MERLFAKYPGEIAAIIVEPIMMNVGILMPDAGYHQALREIAQSNGALLIFDEVKTGAKLARAGPASTSRSSRTLFAWRNRLAAVFRWRLLLRRARAMDLITDHNVFHGGTYNTNPVAMAAGLAMFREVLTREAYSM